MSISTLVGITCLVIGAVGLFKNSGGNLFKTLGWLLVAGVVALVACGLTTYGDPVAKFAEIFGGLS